MEATVIFFGCKNSISDKSGKSEKIVTNKPMVSFTFDDGNTSDLVGFGFEEWNNMILSHLAEENLKAVFFVTGRNKTDDKGKLLLKSWNDSGHKIANHSLMFMIVNINELLV